MSNLSPDALARRMRKIYSRSDRRMMVSASGNIPVTDIRLSDYRDRPVAFARDVLGYHPTEDQATILSSLPGRVKVNSGHNVGKTSIAAVASLWWFYTRDPAVVITTAPTERDVVDLLWTEIRLLHGRARVSLPPFWIGPRAPEMFHHENHWAKGYTARRGESWQGRHRPCMFFLFDESEGIDPIYWQTTDTMYQPGEDHCWLAIGNPVTTSSQSFLEDQALAPDGSPKWKLFTLSALNHPNVRNQLKLLPPPIPNAVSLNQVHQWVSDWCDPIPPTDVRPDRLEWPPGSGIFYRTGPQFQARVQGIRPTGGVDTVWSEAAWVEAIRPKFSDNWCWQNKCGITIGVDTATYGDDNCGIHVRSGPLSLHHESHNGWMPHRIASTVKDLSVQYADWYNSHATEDRPPLHPSEVQTIVELDGVGVSVFDRCDGFGNWMGLKVAEKSELVDSMGRPRYFNKRSEIWFEAAEAAANGQMDLSRLPREVLNRLRLQLTTPYYKMLPAGTQQVEPKEDVKKRLKRSPDDADALVVCYANPQPWSPKVLSREEF